MINAYQNIINYKDDKWEDYLEKLCLYEIFKELFKSYTDKEVIRCVIKYIVYAYSVESDCVFINSDWHKNKQQIYEKAMVKPVKDLYEDLVLLKNPAVVETIQRWLDFQDNDTAKQLSILKDLRSEMQLSAVSKIIKSSGEVDYDQKFKNANYSVDLKDKIKALEDELIQNSERLKEAYKEVQQVKRTSNTIGVENFAK